LAIRTTALAVGKIIEVDDTIDLDSFIEVASALVDEVCEPAGYNATRLELIERWLAAHFYAVRDPRAEMEQADTIRAQYETKVDLGLNVTRYGQQAMLLDTAGGLAVLNRNTQDGQAATPTVGITFLGRTCETDNSCTE
jgi:hypothetical protein